MEEFKKQLFLSSNNAPIKCEVVLDSERHRIKDFVESKLGQYFESQDFFNLFTVVLDKIKMFLSLESSSEIQHAFEDFGLSNQEEVFMIWTYPYDIDKFKLSYLITNWEDIWFGPSDDCVALYFEKVDKIILVTHYHTIYY